MVNFLLYEFYLNKKGKKEIKGMKSLLTFKTNSEKLWAYPNQVNPQYPPNIYSFVSTKDYFGIKKYLRLLYPKNISALQEERKKKITISPSYSSFIQNLIIFSLNFNSKMLSRYYPNSTTITIKMTGKSLNPFY